MFKILLFFCFSSSLFAFVEPNALDSLTFTLEDSIESTFTIPQSFEDKETNNTYEKILKDFKNIVNKNFSIDAYFKDQVHFWFSVYSRYTNDEVVIHDKTEFDLIYKVLDFKDISNSIINKFTKARLQTRLSLEHSKKIKEILIKLGKNPKKLTHDDQEVLSLIKKKRKIPIDKNKRKKFFNKLARDVRQQTGQKDLIYQGFLRFIPYEETIRGIFSDFNLPVELVSITFLESSFNAQAESKVGALGAWQFMPLIASFLLPKRSKILDYRLNPVISTVAAAHLLRENRLILRRLDLAVTAYNSGTKHIQTAQKKLKKPIKDLDLSYLLTHYKHPHLGFASKNFYAEFLALVYALDYKDILFNLSGTEHLKERFSLSKLKLYLTKCDFVPSKLFSLFKDKKIIAELNPQFKRKNSTYKRGSLLVSHVPLTTKKYILITKEVMLKFKPKDWNFLLKNQKCI